MRIVVMPGDGIGPEIVASTVQVLRHADARFGLGLTLAEHEIGFASLAKHGTMLVRDAARFDVVVTTNMFGDILSDEAVELSGSLGLAGSINAGERHCMAQAQHGSAPDIAGQGKANPTSLILSAAMLLQWLSIRHGQARLADAHRAIEGALDVLLADPARRTADLGGTLGTDGFTGALCAQVG